MQRQMDPKGGIPVGSGLFRAFAVKGQLLRNRLMSALPALLKGLGWDEKNQSLTVAAAQDNGMITLFNLAKYITANDGTAKQTPMTSGGSGDIILFSF